MSASTTQALGYLQGLPGVTFKKLYVQPSAALAVFRRMLPHLAKTIVMAMLYMPGPFPATELNDWIRPDSRGDKEQSIAILESLHIISTVQETPKVSAYRLSPAFAKSLRQALTGGGDHRSFGVPCAVPPGEAKNVAFLDEHARKQWEAILYYMVGSSGLGLRASDELTKSTRTLLEMGGYVQSGTRNGITQTGFTFLLQEVNAQVWSLLIVYLKGAPDLQMDPIEVLSFLFMLGSLELGQAYSTANLTPTQLQFLDDLMDYGIVYRPSSKAAYYYPTRLATTLTSDVSALQSSVDGTASGSPMGITNSLRASPENKGYIIIETNYRLYAYTSSVLQISVLALFTKLKTRFPNLVSGKITKNSIQRAISRGITADQIVSYLTTHAHPTMAKNNPVLPPTVVDQIRLWQLEGERMKDTPGHLLKEFPTQNEYEECVRYADSLGVLVWKNDAKRVFFVNKFEQVKMFLQSRMQRSKAQQTQR